MSQLVKGSSLPPPEMRNSIGWRLLGLRSLEDTQIPVPNPQVCPYEPALDTPLLLSQNPSPGSVVHMAEVINSQSYGGPHDGWAISHETVLALAFASLYKAEKLLVGSLLWGRVWAQPS